jgi:hypothetical protein
MMRKERVLNMNSKKKIEKYKGFYESGFWNIQMVRNLVINNKISEDEFFTITGEEFTQE